MSEPVPIKTKIKAGDIAGIKFRMGQQFDRTISPLFTTSKKFKFIVIGREGEESFEGYPVYRVFNNKTKMQLAILSWYKPWKCYVFSSQPECAFDLKCLQDIESFMKSL